MRAEEELRGVKSRDIAWITAERRGAQAHASRCDTQRARGRKESRRGYEKVDRK